MSFEGRGGECDHSPSVLQLEDDPTDDDDGENKGCMLPCSLPRASPAPAMPSALWPSSALTPSYNNRSRLVACEYEEVCSERCLPTSPTSRTTGVRREKPGRSPGMPSLSKSCFTNHSTYWDSLPNSTRVQPMDRLGYSERENRQIVGNVSTFSGKKSKKGKRSEGVIGRIYMRFWGKNNTTVKDVIDYNLDGVVGRRFGYKELARATNNFSSKLQIGKGGFGEVYRGFLKDIQLDVAIKRCSLFSSQGEKEYISEIRVLGQLRHRNLVPFVGWCHEHQELLLVYEFMPNMSLDFYLFSKQCSRKLDWKTRYTIVLGLASALLYLHESLEYCFVHRDIKPNSVLLDDAYNARLTDFGLARIINRARSHVITRLAGTLGYMDPEYVRRGVLSKESDIYSFGIVVLETVTGRSIVFDSNMATVYEWVWNLRGMGMMLEAADKRLDGQFDKKEMECLLLVGLWCSHPDKRSRPNVREVIGVLNFENQLPSLPLTMPVPVYISFSDPMLSLSQTPSYRANDSFEWPELSTDNTKIYDAHAKTSIKIIDNRSKNSTSEHKNSTTLPHTVPAHEENKCEHQVGSSAPTTTLVREEDQRVIVDIALAKEIFDIGISTDYHPTGTLQCFQLPIIEGFKASLQEILKLDPTFDEVLGYMKKFTSTLVALGTPLGDWNSLAQYILRAVKEIDNLKLKMEDEADSSAEIVPFLLNENDTHRQDSEEDADALANSHLQLHPVIQDHVSLTAKYAELQRQTKNKDDACFSIPKQVNDMETSRAKNQTRLESLVAAATSATQKRELKEECKQKITALSRAMLSRITSFSYDV